MSSAIVPAPLTEAEVAEAEHELGVAFPAAYREYLLRVSAGGRCARLERSESGWWWAGNGVHTRALLREPFPHPDSYADADRELDEREPARASFAHDAAFDAAWQARDAHCERFEQRKTAGAIAIEANGCGFATLLVITGPLAGTVWWDGRATCDRIVPLPLDHAAGSRPARFAEWIAHGPRGLPPPRLGLRYKVHL